MENGYPRFPVYVGPRLDLSWDAICRDYKAASQASHRPGALTRQHSILYSSPAFPPPLARQLSDRAQAAAAGVDAVAHDDESDEDEEQATDQETEEDE
mmetsp:Transcript_83084/g.165906  ORF Transcript_83084/g.165906 Transcript_83084/m.165906 type:complete len:98 (+) Transcript_83084:262-555(+)